MPRETLPPGWKLMRLADIGEIVTGKTPPTNRSKYFGNEIPFVTPSDMDHRKTISHTDRSLTTLGVEAVKSALLPPSSVMVSCIGSDLGKVAIAGKHCVTNQQINSVIPFQEFSPDFIYYALLPRKAELQSLAGGGSAQPIINKGHFSQLPIAIPPSREQKGIGNILGRLDDKIELNRRTNETLEAIARAIFKSWFVDFDPVRAKSQGRQPFGMNAETAALFPNSFEDSKLDGIPKGWRAEELRARTKAIQYGLTRSATSNEVGPRFLRITDIQGGRVDWSRVPFCSVSPEEHEKYRILPGDIFVARTGASTGENIYIHKAPNAVFASYLVRLRFAHPGIARVVGEYMRTEDYFDHVGGAIGGSAQPNASAQALASATFAFPPDPIAEQYASLVNPIDQRRVAAAQENMALTSIRDALLPKLISGEIRIKDAEKMVEERV